MALINSQTRSATVVAETDCVLADIDRSSFDSLLKYVPDFSTHVLNVLADEGHDAALALEREQIRTLLFLQQGAPARAFCRRSRNSCNSCDERSSLIPVIMSAISFSSRAVIMSAMGQPASLRGSSTVLSGERIEALSAMK